MNIIKSIVCKWDKLTIKMMISFRKSRLNNTDFTIICNNCWGGYVYRRYGIPYLSPTIGLYFFAEDFLKFCYDLKYYVDCPLKFIDVMDSKWKKELIERNQDNVPIARINDIEVIFLHYKTREEAREKWERRCKRINFDNLIFKFSKMNKCEDEELVEFDRFDVKKKVCFVPNNERLNGNSFIRYKSEQGNEVVDDTSEYFRYINLDALINAKEVNGPTIIMNENNYNDKK